MDFVVAHRDQLHLDLKEGALLVIPDTFRNPVLLDPHPRFITGGEPVVACLVEGPGEPLPDEVESPECFVRYADLVNQEEPPGALISPGKWISVDLSSEEEVLTVFTVTANSPEEQEQLVYLKASFPEDLLIVVDQAESLFQPPDTEPPQRLVKHEIKLVPDAVPVKRSPYPMSPKKLTAMREIMTDLISSGWIKPLNSPWGAPTILVPKKVDVFRLVVDYQDLNSVTVDDSYPLPRLEVLLHRAGRAKFFSKIDLAFGFH